MSIELGYTFDALNNSYATGTAMLAVGALLFIPFALKYGRRPIYLLSLLGQFAIAIWAAKMTTNVDLFLTQAFNCLLGALAEVIVQMTIADVFFVHQRGLMNNLYICTMSIGTALSALVAGYITVGQGWRWVWWWVAILLGTCLLLFVFFYEETKFIPSVNGVLFDPSSETNTKKTKLLDQKPGNDQLKPIDSMTEAVIPPRKSYVQRLKPWSITVGSLKQLTYHSYQPLVILCTIPAVMYVALLFGLVTAGLQVCVTLVATYMPIAPYNFDAAQIGLMGLPMFIGNVIGTLLSAPFIDRIILLLARKNRGIYEPEMRLWLMLAFAPLLPVGMILFGYALGKGMSWPVVAVGLGMFSAGMAPVCSVSLTYLTDAYTDVSLC